VIVGQPQQKACAGWRSKLPYLPSDRGPTATRYVMNKARIAPYLPSDRGPTATVSVALKAPELPYLPSDRGPTATERGRTMLVA